MPYIHSMNLFNQPFCSIEIILLKFGLYLNRAGRRILNCNFAIAVVFFLPDVFRHHTETVHF